MTTTDATPDGLSAEAKRSLAMAKRQAFLEASYGHYLELQAMLVQDPGPDEAQRAKRDRIVAELTVKMRSAAAAARRIEEILSTIQSESASS